MIILFRLYFVRTFSGKSSSSMIVLSSGSFIMENCPLLSRWKTLFMISLLMSHLYSVSMFMKMAYSCVTFRIRKCVLVSLSNICMNRLILVFFMIV